MKKVNRMIAIMLSVLLLAAALILGGLIVAVISVYGNYKFKFVLNRMHAAAMNDTLGILFVLLGLMVLKGMTMISLKFLLIILFLWFASPVSSHLIARLEVTVNEKLEEECKVVR